MRADWTDGFSERACLAKADVPRAGSWARATSGTSGVQLAVYGCPRRRAAVPNGSAANFVALGHFQAGEGQSQSQSLAVGLRHTHGDGGQGRGQEGIPHPY